MRTSKLTEDQVGLKHGFRSGLEGSLARSLEQRGIPFSFEQLKLKYERPARVCTYTPDFHIPHATDKNHRGIVVETKGRFVTADRQKHLWVKATHPDCDIRFVFSSSRVRISKQSTTTYAAWCERNGFLFADKALPTAWLIELGYTP